MALGQYSEHGDHSLSPFEPGVCIGFRTLTLSVRKHAMSLGQNSEHLDHSASPLEPAACAVLVFLLPGVHHMARILRADLIRVASNIPWLFSTLVLHAHLH